MAIVNAATASAADIQTAINSAVDGVDTVLLPASASATWNVGSRLTTAVTKNITIDGNGSTITQGTGFSGVSNAERLINLDITGKTGNTRLTNFNFVQTFVNNIVATDGNYSAGRVRIDNCTFTGNLGLATAINWYQLYGLIDHCTFSYDDASEMIHNMGSAVNTTSNTEWNATIAQGTSAALYIEDSTLKKYDLTDTSFWGTSAIQSYYGASTVIRYNNIVYCQIDQHGTAGNVGARWWEIYNNSFWIPTNGGTYDGGAGTHNQSNFLDIRAGSGVIYSNTVNGGTNAGSGTFQLREEDSGYPALWQVGRGKDSSFPPTTGSDQALDPAYCWSNGKTPVGDAMVVDARDFYSNTVKSGYTAYTYPHPLQGAAPASTRGLGFILNPH